MGQRAVIGLQAYIDRVADLLRRIRTADGWLTDIGANVSTERISGNGEEKKLLVGVFLADLTKLAQSTMRRDWQFDLQAEARIPVKWSSAEATAVSALEDMSRAVPTSACDLGEQLQTFEILSGSIIRESEGVPYIVVSVSMRATCFEYTTPAQP